MQLNYKIKKDFVFKGNHYAVGGILKVDHDPLGVDTAEISNLVQKGFIELENENL